MYGGNYNSNNNNYNANYFTSTSGTSNNNVNVNNSNRASAWVAIVYKNKSFVVKLYRAADKRKQKKEFDEENPVRFCFRRAGTCGRFSGIIL